MKTLRMDEMTAPLINEAIKNGYTTVVVAVGSTEQHGPHLPTMTDTRIGDEIANRVAVKLGNALHAKTIPVGISDHHLPFGGTVSLKPETLYSIIIDYMDSLVQCGFKKIIFLPSHGGNFGTTEKAINACRDKYPAIQILGYTNLLGYAGFLQKLSNEFEVTNDESGAHAGENETSIMMCLEPDLVQKEKFEAGYLGPTGEKEVSIILEQGMPALAKNGILGNPRKAFAEHGEVYLDKLSDFLINELL